MIEYNDYSEIEMTARYGTEKECLARLAKNKSFSHAEYDGFRGSKEVVLWAIRIQGGFSFMFAGDELRDNKEFVLEAVKINGNVLQGVSSRLKGDEEVVMAAITKYPHALQYANKELLSNKDFLLQVLSKNGDLLDYVVGRLKEDEEVVLVAIRNDKSALLAASKRIREEYGGGTSEETVRRLEAVVLEKRAKAQKVDLSGKLGCKQKVLQKTSRIKV